MRTRPASPAATTMSLEPLMEMNMTPLIDVMLVLIIMLIITIPRQNHAIGLTLPTVSTQTDQPVIITIGIDFDGVVSWNGTAVASRADLETRLAAVAAASEPTSLQIRANKLVPYKYLAGVMAAAQRLGVRNLGVIEQTQ
ncbi:MAG: biopolymer transporter ExbD [Pseudomonadota bacterium]